MSDFDTIAASALSEAYSLFGDAATFSPNVGPSIDCTVVVHQSGEWQGGGSMQVRSGQTLISYRRSEIDRKLKVGEKFIVGSTTYTVRAMAQENSWTEYEGTAVVSEDVI